MRFIWLCLVVSVAAVGCKKDPPPSESTKLTPATQPGVVSADSRTADVEEPAVAVEVEDEGADEGHGEPMDDVDEAESDLPHEGSDKAGAAHPEPEDGAE